MRRPILTALAAGLMSIATSASGENLLDVYRTALESDPQLAAAAAARQAVEEARPQARANLRPNVNAAANLSYTSSDVHKSASAFGGDRDYDSKGYDLSVTQAVYHRDYLVQLRQADAQIAQAEAEYLSAHQALATRVATAYFNVLAAEDSLAFAQAEERAIAQQLRQTKQRFEVGLSAITDVQEAQAAYDASVAQSIAARSNVDVTREALRAIADRAYEQLAPVADTMPLVSPEPANIDTWVAKALEQNLDLAALDAAAQVASQRVELARAAKYPDLDLVARHQYSDSVEATLGARRDDTTLSLQLSMPLWTGGRIEASVREASSRYTQAQQLLEQQRRTTIRSARDAFLRVTTGISQVAAQKQAVSSAKTALEATQAGFEVGTRTIVDVLAAQRDVFRAERDFTRARYDYIIAVLQLKQAAGTLAEEDIAQVNGWLKTGQYP